MIDSSRWEVLEEGLTDLTPGVDLDGLRGQAGFGPPTADPGAAGAGWTWVAAVPNPAWNNAVNDEYMAPLSVPEAGTYDFAFRYTLDDGFTWLYCDTDRRSDGGADGSADGYQQANAGHVVVEGGPCEDDPCAVPPAPECAVDGVTLITYLPGACSIDGEGHACDWPSTEWDCSAAEGACDGGVCVGGLPNPDWGEVVITEIMYDPHTGLVEGESEWFEVKNVGGRRVSLDTCVVGDSSSVVEVAGVNLDPGALGLFASSDAPAPGTAIVPDHLFGFSLSNNGDAVHVTCGETLVDQVAYDDGPVFPNARQASLNLDPTAEHALANDDGVDWCLGATPYWGDPGAGSEHLGTPGEDNPSCVWVDWCRLQSPSDQQMTTADTVTVYGRVYEEGLTDGGPGVDAHDDLRAQVGYGAATARPWAAADWTWVAAAANPGWNGPDAGEDHNDEYEAELAELPEGDYDVAYRFSLDGGVSWRYCDRDRRADGGDDGSADGYQQADAGTLSVLPAE